MLCWSVDMEISSTKHKLEWRKQNKTTSSVIASSCRQTPDDKTTTCSFTMARELSCALSHRNNQGQNFTPLNSCSHSISPWSRSWGSWKCKCSPEAAKPSSRRSPGSIPALPARHWQQDRSLICSRKWTVPPIPSGVSCSRWQWQFSSLLWQVLQHLIAFRQTNWRSSSLHWAVFLMDTVSNSLFICK